MDFERLTGDPVMNKHNLRPRPNSVLYVLLYNTDYARCSACNNVVLFAKKQIPGNEFYCFHCHDVRGYGEVYTGEEQTPEEFDRMLDAVTMKLGLDNNPENQERE